MQKLYLTIPLLTLALIATGCAADKTTTSTNEGVNTNTAVVNTNQPVETETEVTPSEEVDEYEGWETYTNEEYGFSFKYPDDWNISDDGIGNFPVTINYIYGVQLVKPQPNEQYDLNTFFLGVLNNTDEIDVLLSEIQSGFESGNNSGYIQTEVSIGSQSRSATMYKFYLGMGDFGDPNTRLIVVKNGDKVFYTVESNYGQEEAVDTANQKIINTISFS